MVKWSSGRADQSGGRADQGQFGPAMSFPGCYGLPVRLTPPITFGWFEHEFKPRVRKQKSVWFLNGVCMTLLEHGQFTLGNDVLSSCGLPVRLTPPITLSRFTHKFNSELKKEFWFSFQMVFPWAAHTGIDDGFSWLWPSGQTDPINCFYTQNKVRKKKLVWSLNGVFMALLETGAWAMMSFLGSDLPGRQEPSLQPVQDCVTQSKLTCTMSSLFFTV